MTPIFCKYMSYSFLINHFNLEFTHFPFHLFFFVVELHNTYSVIYKRFSDIYSFVIVVCTCPILTAAN